LFFSCLGLNQTPGDYLFSKKISKTPLRSKYIYFIIPFDLLNVILILTSPKAGGVVFYGVTDGRKYNPAGSIQL
jgi:hypothetical protein